VDNSWTRNNYKHFSLTLIFMNMKQLMKTLALAAVALLFAANSFGQASATANATATIVAPIAIANTSALAFGNVAVSATNLGTVTVATDGSRSALLGVTLPVVAGTVSAAAFTVTGEGTSTYAITLPVAAVTLTGSGGGTMTVDTFTSNPSGTGTLAAGTQNIAVGGTLHVGAAQTPGNYTGSFTVTVNYN
jgi:hypothetical protein